MKPINLKKPDPNQSYDLATAQDNWNAARDFIFEMLKRAGLTPGDVQDGSFGPFGQWEEIGVEIKEFPGVVITTLTGYEELEYSTGSAQCTHFEIADDGGQVHHNGKDLMYETPDEVIDNLKGDLTGYNP